MCSLSSAARSMDEIRRSITTTGSTKYTNIKSSRPGMARNLHLIWLDENNDQVSNMNCRDSIAKVQEMVNTVSVFIDIDQCIDFITDIEEESVFLISSGMLSQTKITLIQDIPQINCIYICCEHTVQDEHWSKVQDVFTDITSLCEALKKTVHEWHQNNISMSFIAIGNDDLDKNLDELDQSFMYTQILKETLLTIDFEPEHTDEFITYCRNRFAGNASKLKTVDQFEKDYRSYTPVWWYTSPYFLYSMLNQGLRVMEVDLIIKMGFFVRDLHEHIIALHSEQFIEQDHCYPFTVYRGQGLSHSDFSQLLKSEGGLMSFNNFLSTSLDRTVALAFAESNQSHLKMIGVLFQITIDSSISATPFAKVHDVSHYQTEEEILFSMHSIFRIGQIQSVDDTNRLWQVDLTLTSDRDPQLHAVTECIREEYRLNKPGWCRLGYLLILLGDFDKAEQLYEILLNRISDDDDAIVGICHSLARINTEQGRYQNAIKFHKILLECFEKNLPSTHPANSISYNDIALVYHKMGNFSTALSYLKRSLDIDKNNFPPDHLSLATAYSNISIMYTEMGLYPEALMYHQKAFEIYQKTLPPNHPTLAIAYISLGDLYAAQGEDFKALAFYKKTLEIQQKVLPSNHPNMAISYDHIGGVHRKLNNYSEALSSYEKALEFKRKMFSPDHLQFAVSYGNIGGLYGHMGEHSKAISLLEKGIEICQKNDALDHPICISLYYIIGSIYCNTNDYSLALAFHNKSIDICQKTLHSNHPNLATVYISIARVYYLSGDYSQAISYYQRPIEIYTHVFSPDHRSLIVPYHNIGLVYDAIEEYSNALVFLEKALAIQEKILSSNHLDIATSYDSIGSVYLHLQKHSEALSSFQKVLDIQQKTLPPNHSTLVKTYANISLVYRRLGNYSEALTSYEKVVDINQQLLPSNHSDLAFNFKKVGLMYLEIGANSKALLSFEKVLNIYQDTLSSGDLELADCYNNLGLVYREMGDNSNALSSFERALEIGQRSSSPDHSYLQMFEENIRSAKK